MEHQETNPEEQGARNPSPPPENFEKKEGEPVSYETILATARKIKEAGAPDPQDEEDERVRAVYDLIDEWSSARGINPGRIDSVEKAKDAALLARIWIDAGYTAEAVLRAALEKLRDLRADAKHKANDPSIEGLFDEAVTKLEKGLKQKSRPEQILAEKLTEVDECATRGELDQAISLLAIARIDPRFKGKNKAILALMKQVNERYGRLLAERDQRRKQKP